MLGREAGQRLVGFEVRLEAEWWIRKDRVVTEA